MPGRRSRVQTALQPHRRGIGGGPRPAWSVPFHRSPDRPLDVDPDHATGEVRSSKTPVVAETWNRSEARHSGHPSSATRRVSSNRSRRRQFGVGVNPEGPPGRDVQVVVTYTSPGGSVSTGSVPAKQCTDCGQVLPSTEFYWVSKSLGTLRGQCKACMRRSKIAQRDPAWTPNCSRCDVRLPERTGSGRRLCDDCFGQTYDLEHRRANGAHRVRLMPCSLCGGPKEHVARGKVCPGLQAMGRVRQVAETLQSHPC